MPHRNLIIAIALVIATAIAAVAALAVAGFGSRAASEPLHATVLPEPLPLPQFTLTDHAGAPFTLERLRGRTSLLFFGFTHCPDICPATLQQLALARKQIAADGVAPPPDIVLISVDPERDTPEILGRYVAHFGEGVTAATGDRDALLELTSPLGVFFAKEFLHNGDDKSNYTVGHSTAVLVVDEHAAFKAVFSAPHEVESFVHDIPLLMAAK